MYSLHASRPCVPTEVTRKSARLSRATHEKLVELRARTGMSADALLYALLTEALGPRSADG